MPVDHDTIGDVQPHSQAMPLRLTGRLRRRERLEQVRHDFLRNTGPSVDDLDHRMVRMAARADSQFAVPVHRLDGIFDDPGPHLARKSRQEVPAARRPVKQAVKQAAKTDLATPDQSARLVES